MCDAMYPLAPVTRTHSLGAILRSVRDIGVVGAEVVSLVVSLLVKVLESFCKWEQCRKGAVCICGVALKSEDKC